MLLGANHSLEDTVIPLIAQKGRTTAQDLHQKIGKQHAEVTIQGIYRVLRKLQKEGVIVKEKKVYSLRIPWLLDIMLLVDTMEKTYLQENYMSHLLPMEEGQQRIWYFTNNLKMSDFWSQLLLAMAKKSDKKISLNYCPHAWFHLVQKEQEEQFVKTFLQSIHKDYIIIGGKTALDQYTAKALSPYEAECSYLANPDEYIEKDRSKYICIIGQFVLIISLEPQVATKIDTFYKDVWHSDEISSADMLHLLSDLLTERTKIKIVLKNNHILAKKYYKKFEKVFGPLE